MTAGEKQRARGRGGEGTDVLLGDTLLTRRERPPRKHSPGLWGRFVWKQTATRWTGGRVTALLKCTHITLLPATCGTDTNHQPAPTALAFLGSKAFIFSKSTSTDSSFKCFFSFPISNLRPYCFTPDQAKATKMAFLALPSPETPLNISNHLKRY